MIRPDERVLSALARLEAATEFKIVMDWFEESLHSQDVSNRTAKGEVLLNGQGKAQEVAEIIKHAKDARKIMHKKNSS